VLDIDALRATLATTAQDEEAPRTLGDVLKSVAAAFIEVEHPRGPDGKFIAGIPKAKYIPGLKTPWSGGQSDAAAGLNKKFLAINEALASDDPVGALEKLPKYSVSNHPNSVKYHKYLAEAKGMAAMTQAAKLPPPDFPTLNTNGPIGKYHGKLASQMQAAQSVEDLNKIALPASSPKALKEYQAALYAHHSNGKLTQAVTVAAPKKLGPLPPTHTDDVSGWETYGHHADGTIESDHDLGKLKAAHAKGAAAVEAYQPMSAAGKDYKADLLASKAPAKGFLKPKLPPVNAATTGYAPGDLLDSEMKEIKELQAAYNKGGFDAVEALNEPGYTAASTYKKAILANKPKGLTPTVTAGPKTITPLEPFDTHPSMQSYASGTGSGGVDHKLHKIKELHDTGDLDGLEKFQSGQVTTPYKKAAIASLKAQQAAGAVGGAAPTLGPLPTSTYMGGTGDYAFWDVNGNQVHYQPSTGTGYEIQDLQNLHAKGDHAGVMAYKPSSPAAKDYKAAMLSPAKATAGSPTAITPFTHPASHPAVIQHDVYNDQYPNTSAHLDHIKELHDKGDLAGLKALKTPPTVPSSVTVAYKTEAIASLEGQLKGSTVHFKAPEVVIDTTPSPLASAAGKKHPMPALPPAPAVDTKYPVDQQELFKKKVKALQDAYNAPDPAGALANIPVYAPSLQTYKGELLAKVNAWEASKPFKAADVGETVSTLKVVGKSLNTPGPRADFPQVQHEHLNKAAAQYRAALPGPQAQALSSYQGSGYSSINSHLRSGGAATEKIRNLDKALGNAVLDRDLRVIRNFGSKLHEGQKGKSLLGRIIEDPAFMSTSLHGSFGSYANTSLHLNVPKGTRGLYLNSQGSTSAYEYEVLLPRNTRYHVDHVEYKNGQLVIKATVLPPHQQTGWVK
jgi:hypothetical protein